MVAAGNYGPVRVRAGRYKGRVGYYDDDGYDAKVALVYFGSPLAARIPFRRAALDAVDVVCLDVERWVRAHPYIARTVGIVSHRRPRPLAAGSVRRSGRQRA